MRGGGGDAIDGGEEGGAVGIAISLASYKRDADYAFAARFAADLALAAVARVPGFIDAMRGNVLNVNVPAIPAGAIKGVKRTVPGKSCTQPDWIRVPPPAAADADYTSEGEKRVVLLSRASTTTRPTEPPTTTPRRGVDQGQAVVPEHARGGRVRSHGGDRLARGGRRVRQRLGAGVRVRDDRRRGGAGVLDRETRSRRSARGGARGPAGGGVARERGGRGGSGVSRREGGEWVSLATPRGGEASERTAADGGGRAIERASVDRARARVERSRVLVLK